MFERFIEQARRALFFSRYEASRHGQRTIELEHLLLGVIRERIARDLLIGAHVPLDQLRAAIESHLVRDEYLPTSIEIPFSAETKRALQFAAEEADRLGHSYVGAEHLVLGVLREHESFVASVLGRYGLSLDGAREQVVRLTGEGK
jgi:ATP-dependent Clp protease ATP-binding subunit ClpC